jgi:hypothetical protein
VNGQSGDRFIDPQQDPVSLYDSYDESDEAGEEGELPGDEPDAPADPAGESLIVELCERLNARDFDGLEELLDPEATSGFLQASSREEVMAALMELVERYPGLLCTRGELGAEPVLGLWVVDPAQGDHDLVGVMRFDWSDGQEPLLTGLEVVEPDGTQDLLLERPDPDEIEEWDDWRLLDED